MKLICARGCKVSLSMVFALILSMLPLAAGPDLAINAHRARITVDFRYRAFTARDCAVEEGCVWNTGVRKLLRLDVGVVNNGKHDLVIGDPYRRPEMFEWSGCHGHFHMKGLATYRLLTLTGRQVAKTYKQGFCLRDVLPASANPGPSKYTCSYQGISSGWQDVYDKSLECQWIDITGVPPGNYRLEITVNPAHRFVESNYRNNRVILSIYVPKYAPYY